MGMEYHLARELLSGDGKPLRIIYFNLGKGNWSAIKNELVLFEKNQKEELGSLIISNISSSFSDFTTLGYFRDLAGKIILWKELYSTAYGDGKSFGPVIFMNDIELGERVRKIKKDTGIPDNETGITIALETGSRYEENT